MTGLFDGTSIGADGKRYPTGTQPTDPKPYRRAATDVYGKPVSGQAPLWDPTEERLEWGVANTWEPPLEWQLDSGEYVPQRRYDVNSLNGSVASGSMLLHFFTALRTETIDRIQNYTGTTAYAPTPTVCRLGIYGVDASGNGMLLNAIANDTTLWSAANATYTRFLTSDFSKVKGSRYAIGVLAVSSAAVGSFLGASVGGIVYEDTAMSRPARTTGIVTGLADLPASFTAASVTNNRRANGYYIVRKGA